VEECPGKGGDEKSSSPTKAQGGVNSNAGRGRHKKEKLEKFEERGNKNSRSKFEKRTGKKKEEVHRLEKHAKGCVGGTE